MMSGLNPRMSIGVCGRLAFSTAVRTRKVENPAISATVTPVMIRRLGVNIGPLGRLGGGGGSDELGWDGGGGGGGDAGPRARRAPGRRSLTG